MIKTNKDEKRHKIVTKWKLSMNKKITPQNQFIQTRHTLLTLASLLSRQTMHYPKLSAGGRSFTDGCWGLMPTAGCSWTWRDWVECSLRGGQSVTDGACACREGSLYDSCSLNATDGACLCGSLTGTDGDAAFTLQQSTQTRFTWQHLSATNKKNDVNSFATLKYTLTQWSSKQSHKLATLYRSAM